LTDKHWVRLVFDSSSLIRGVTGNCEGILGVPSRALRESREPLRLLSLDFDPLPALSAAAEPVLATFGDLLTIAEPAEGGGLSMLIVRSAESGESQGPVDDLAAGVVGVDSSGVVRLWNKAMAEIFHVARETAIGSALDAVLPQPVLFTWSSVLMAVGEGRQVKVEVRPGQDRRVEAVFAVGGPGILGTFSDTSDSFQTEKRLRTARRMNQTYLQTVRTGLVMFGPDYRLLVANKAFGDIFGLREVLLGMPIYEIVPSECFAELERNSRQLFEEDQAIPPVAISCCPRDGRNRVVIQTFKPVRSEDEESFLVVGVFDDISGQARAETDLEAAVESRLFLSSLLSSVTSASLPAGSTALAGDLCRALGATAAAVYLSQPYSTTRLTGTAGQWKASLPFDFSDLHLPPSVWNLLPGSALSGHELGALMGIAEFCIAVPVGAGSANRGFLLASFPDEARAADSIQSCGMVADILRLRADFVSQSSQLEQITYFLERHRRFLREFIGSADVPAAVFGEDWRVVHWNRSMESVTGCTAETARKRTTMVMDMLFGPVGGIASARKLVKRFGTADAPAVWEIRKADGTSTSMAWRLFRADAAETDSMEAMTVLLGAPLAIGASSHKEVEANADRFDALNRGLIRLVASESMLRLAESVASVAAAISGARRVHVELDSPEGPVRASSVAEEAGEQDAEVWSVPLQIGSRNVGMLTLEGGSSAPLVGDFARAAARVLQRHEEASLGGRIDSLLRTGGGFLVCDSAGRVILSSLRTAAEGVPITPGTNLFEEAAGDAAALRLAFDTALRMGRSAYNPSSAGRFSEPVFMQAIRSSKADSLFIIIPLASFPQPELLPLEPCSWSTALGNLIDALPLIAASARDRLTGISRILGRDDPVRPAISALNYDFASIGRAASLLHLLFRSTFPSPSACHPAQLLDDLANSFVRSGRRPPDMRIEGDLPSLSADPAILSEVFGLLSEIGGQGDVPEFAVSEVGGSGAALARQPGAAPAVIFSVTWKRRIVTSSSLADALGGISKGDLGTPAGLAMAILSLKLTGCDSILSEDGLTMTIIVPAALE
jgi:PAS domain S-box-containing protein